MTTRPNLRGRDKARLRDWYDTSGTWPVKMCALYDLVDQIISARTTLAWEQGHAGCCCEEHDEQCGPNPYGGAA